MPNVQHHVCVGGPHDGKFRETPEGQRRFDVQVRRMVTDVAAVTGEALVCDYEVYHLEPIHIKGQEPLHFWRHAKLGFRDALAILLNSHGARRQHG